MRQRRIRLQVSCLVERLLSGAHQAGRETVEIDPKAAEEPRVSHEQSLAEGAGRVDRAVFLGGNDNSAVFDDAAMFH